jgi:hypothetical protein
LRLLTLLAWRISLPLFGRAWQRPDRPRVDRAQAEEGRTMNSIVYIVGLVVIVVAILSFLGLR